MRSLRGNAPYELHWILDVANRHAYIFRNPTPAGYQSETALQYNGVIAPLAFPDIPIPLSELFLPLNPNP
ncbi:MAG: hypothetical protein KME26_33570 [Oscillatoria princeps RMCB-10]|nr:hypothetical protein [Oscillatoria princeps RMCB-10]